MVQQIAVKPELNGANRHGSRDTKRASETDDHAHRDYYKPELNVPG